MIDTSQFTITDHDLEQILNTPPQPEVLILHYVHKKNLTLPALCGEEPASGIWSRDMAKRAKASNTRTEICPACQVKYSYRKG